MPTVLALALSRFPSACWPGPRRDCPLPGGCPPAYSPAGHLHPAFTSVFQKLERESGAVILSLVIPVLGGLMDTGKSGC